METIYGLIAIGIILALLLEQKRKVSSAESPPSPSTEESKKSENTQSLSPSDSSVSPLTEETAESENPNSLPIEAAYHKKWLFSYNEKDAYSKLKVIADELGYTVFAKVRLLDLLEPVSGIPKYKTYFYKVQAKHVDFVLCDEKLVARYIIELDDSTHKRENRKTRDEFVDEVVTSVGYKIFHIQAITDDLKEKLK